MTAGLAASLANGWLDELTGLFMKMHTGDPGSAGTSNASAETERKSLTLAAAAAGSRAATATFPSWTAWDAGTETISHVSVWDHVSAGTFKYSFALTASKSVTNGDSLSLTSHTISVTPIAA